MTEFERGYVSGIIDGEGCFTLVKCKNRGIKRGFQWAARLTICNTDLKMLLEVKRILKGGSIRRDYDISNLWRKKPVYRYTASPNLLRRILPQLKFITKYQDGQHIIQTLQIIQRGRKTDRWRPDKVQEKDILLEGLYQRLRKRQGRYKVADRIGTRHPDSALR